MSHNFEYVDLTGDPLDIALVLDLVFLQNFDGNLFTCDEVSSESDLAECALAQ